MGLVGSFKSRTRFLKFYLCQYILKSSQRASKVQCLVCLVWIIDGRCQTNSGKSAPGIQKERHGGVSDFNWTIADGDPVYDDEFKLLLITYLQRFEIRFLKSYRHDEKYCNIGTSENYFSSFKTKFTRVPMRPANYNLPQQTSQVLFFFIPLFNE